MRYFNYILNPFWIVENFLTLRSIGAMAGGSILSGVLGGVLGGIFGPDDPDIPPVTDSRTLVERGLDIRKDNFPELLRIRGEFDPRFFNADASQVQRSQNFQEGLLRGDILDSIRRQRGDLLTSDTEQFTSTLSRQANPFREALFKLSPEFANVSQGVQRDQNLLDILRGQVTEDVQRRGELGPEELRAVQQATSSQVGRRGRGALFGLGQLALNQESAQRARESQRRNDAFSVLAAGGALDNRGLGAANFVASPFLNLLGQTQAANRSLVGSPLQSLQLATNFARSSQPNIPLFDPNLINLESLKQGQALNQASLQLDAGRSRADLIAGGFSGGANLGGSLFSPSGAGFLA